MTQEAAQSLVDLGQEGQVIDVFAVLRRIEKREAKNGQPFWNLTLADQETSVDGRIWSSDKQAAAAITDLEPGTSVKIRGRVDSYQGKQQLIVQMIRPVAEDEEGFDPARLYGDAPAWLAELSCKTLVFDIETVPDSELRDLPPTIVKTLSEHCERKERDQSMVMGLSPFFGKTISLAFGEGEADAEEQDVTVLVVPPDNWSPGELPEWIRPMSEAELLNCFWALSARADLVVTYNGRGFDLPFLVARSLILGVPARVDLMSERWGLRPHLDLFEIMSQRGRGPSNLDVVCWALDIQSPKGEMDGSMVAPAYERGDLDQIAMYNREDVRATTAVYHRVRDSILKYRKDWARG
ncbi:MAG: ribonuclease H-like domain-containing protein [Planctomycetota bacterium]|jgi:predicted PolB exonuclease-like 3'-5' exonuclease